LTEIAIIVKVKSVHKILKEHEGQLVHYLTAMK
jgi:hypothetical protein